MHQWIQMDSISSTFFKRRRKSTSTEESRLISFQRCTALRIPRGEGGPWGFLGVWKKIFWGVCLGLKENLGGSLIFVFIAFLWPSFSNFNPPPLYLSASMSLFLRTLRHPKSGPKVAHRCLQDSFNQYSHIVDDSHPPLDIRTIQRKQPSHFK